MGVEPTITCSSCGADIKLTESLAAPLIEATRLQYEKRLAPQNALVAQRKSYLSAVNSLHARSFE